jgi:hypothetical protein
MDNVQHDLELTFGKLMLPSITPPKIMINNHINFGDLPFSRKNKELRKKGRFKK